MRTDLEYIDRDPRWAADIKCLDLGMTDQGIHAALRKRWPGRPALNWELEQDELSGWVYDGNKILCRLRHASGVREVA